MAGASPVICRRGMAGRRATVSGGAIRCGRTAVGCDGGRAAAAALFPGPSVGRPGAGRAPAPDEPGEPPEPEETDEPVGAEELDEVADPDLAASEGPDTAPDRAA
ncbi:hypothetical protein [Streptomyces globisporus]|uniref:hypothetical protein n=1 Tax=Streptomyces globisporus TaxID=1908 RepID=UPI0036A8D1E6